MATSFSDAVNGFEQRAAHRILGRVELDTLIAGFKTSGVFAWSTNQ
jgi:hypothetical protein